MPFVNDNEPLKLCLILDLKLKKYSPVNKRVFFYRIILSFKLQFLTSFPQLSMFSLFNCYIRIAIIFRLNRNKA